MNTYAAEKKLLTLLTSTAHAIREADILMQCLHPYLCTWRLEKDDKTHVTFMGYDFRQTAADFERMSEIVNYYMNHNAGGAK